MTARRCFEFGMASDVRRMFVLIVLFTILDILPSKGEANDRDSRKLFGGYRITPSYCKASRAAKHNRGSTICMFNHECVRRGGEVVGTCMDGFLFGACCQLKSDSQSHIPKGPGVVMTSYLDYPDPDAETETEDYDLTAWHNSFKPIVTPGYRPGDKTPGSGSTGKPADQNLSTEGVQAEIISEGFSQITNSLLQSPPKEDNFVYIKPVKPDNVYTHSTIDHNVADTILMNKNGTAADNIARPSDFNIQISSMQTKPTVAPSTSPSAPPKTVSTHRPVYTKPVFKPKPTNINKSTTTTTTKNPTTENYVMVSTVTKESQKVTELSSINSIIQMLNDSTPSVKEDVTSPATETAETKSSPTPSATVAPVSYSSGYPTYISTGHYVTLKPYQSSTYNIQSSTYSSTVNYPSVQSSTYSTTVKYPNKKPTFTTKIPTYSTANSIQEKLTTKPYVTSKPSQSTSQAIDAFNRYPTDPTDFGDSVTTFSYVSSTTTRRPATTTTRRPPSTSYVTGAKPSRKPVTSYSTPTPSYDIAPDTFSSVTPTVIVLNGFQTTKPDSSEEPQFVEISQEPFKKPVSQITVNNHIESTNNIYMGKPPVNYEKPTSIQYERPSSPTILITPKPSPNTTPYPIKTVASSRPVVTTSPAYDSYYTDFYSSTTFKPEMQTSPDDLINFPPVRNPMLNATGSNPSLYINTSVAISDINEIDTLHDLEFTTPTWQEDEKLNEKMNLFVNKIVGSLQGTFQELHDIVILDKKPNSTIIRDTKTTTQKPKRTLATTRRPTTRKPIRATTTTKKPPVKTTKKPAKLTTAARRPTTTTPPPTTTTKKSLQVTTTKKAKPTKKVTTTTAASTTVTELADEVTTEPYIDQNIDFNDKNHCSSRRKPGMSLGSGAIRRSLYARTVVQCEAACFSEREFKCVSYSYRYSNSHGSDNCFLSERPYRGLDLAQDSGSDVYAMPEDHGCPSVSTKPFVESECFWHVRSGAAVDGTAVKAALTVAGLGACEAECIRAHAFFCRGFSFRFDSPTIGDDLENCILTSTPPTSLETGHGLRSNAGHELYARGNYGRGCEPALYDDIQHRETGECYLQYDNAAKLIGTAIKGSAKVRDEQSCGKACTDAPFRCLSFSYNNNAPPDTDNCLLSEIRLFDLQRGVDYEHSTDDWLFAFDLFNGQCWRKVHGKGDYDQPAHELPKPLFPPHDGFSSSAPSGPSSSATSGPSGPGYLPAPVPPEPYVPSGPPTGPYKPYPEPRPDYKPSYPSPGYLPAESPGYLPKPSYEPSGSFLPSVPSGPRPSAPGYLPSGPPDSFRPSPPGEPFIPSRPVRPGYPDTGPIASGRPGYPDTGSIPPARPGYPSTGYGPPPVGAAGLPGPPDRPREEPIAVSWRHYTVSGLPCRQGTSCAQNQVSGHWSCEPEAGEIGAWDYCCAPTHRCGYSEGFHKPWCYVGPSPDQWRPCSEKYYPYHQHNIPHPSQVHIRPDRPIGPPGPPVHPGPPEPPGPPHLGPPSRPVRIPPGSFERPDLSYLPEADRRYWDDLYNNGPRAYYDKYGNPLPGYTRVPTADRPYIKYSHNPPRPPTGQWVPVTQPELDPLIPGGLGVPRYWPVAYLHKESPPNTTYFKYNQTERPISSNTERNDPRPSLTSRDHSRDSNPNRDHSSHFNPNRDYSRDDYDTRDHDRESSRDYNKNKNRNNPTGDYSRNDYNTRNRDRESSRDYNRDSNRNYARDDSSNYDRDDNRKYDRGPSRENDRDSNRNFDRQPSKEYTEPSRDYNRDSHRDYDRERSRDGDRDDSINLRDYSREPTRDKTPPRERPPQSFTSKVNSDKPTNNNIDNKSHRDEKTMNITNTDEEIMTVDLDKTTTTTPKSEIKVDENDKLKETKSVDAESAKTDGKDAMDKELENLKGIDGKIDDFSKSIEVLDIEDAKKGEKISDLKTLEAEERQIEAIGRLLASRRGTQLVLEKRSQKDLESKSIALDKDLVDFNFGNKFPASNVERRGTVQRVTKEELARERLMDKSLEVSETTFVRPPRVLSTTENIRKAIVNGKVFYSASINQKEVANINNNNTRRENHTNTRRDLTNSTRKAKSLRPLEERAPSILSNANYGKKKVVRTRNVNPVRKVRRVYRRKYNPDEVRRRLLEREKSMKENSDNRKL